MTSTLETSLTCAREEHQRRSPECLFFALTASLKTKNARGKKNRQSKASRLSVQSSVSALLDDHTIDEVQATEDDSVLTTATNMTTKSMAPKPSKKGTKAKLGHSKFQAKPTQDEAGELMDTNDIVEPEDDNFEVKVELTPAKNTRGKKRSSDEMEESCTTNVRVVMPPPKRRTTRAQNSTVGSQYMSEPTSTQGEDVANDANMISAEDMGPPPLPVSKKGGRKRASTTTRKASTRSIASTASLRAPAFLDDQIDAALEADLDRPLTDDENVVQSEVVEKPKPKSRRLTRTKPASKKAKASVAPVRTQAMEDVEMEDQADIALQKDENSVPTVDVGASQPAAEATERDPALPLKSKRGKKATKTQPAPEAMTDSPDREMDPLEATMLEHAQTFGEVHSISDKLEPSMSSPAPIMATVQPVAASKPGAPRSRQASRQLPKSEQDTATASTVHIVIEQKLSSDDPVAAERSIQDDLGHETDASTLRGDAAKAKGRKTKGAPRKGKGSRKGATKSQSRDEPTNVSAAEAQIFVKDSASAKVQSPHLLTQPSVELLKYDSTMVLDLPSPLLEPSKLEPESAKTQTRKEGSKTKEVLPTPMTSQSHSDSADSSFVAEQPSKVEPSTPAQPSPIPKEASPAPASPRPTSKDGVLSPTPSPQSSDAENHPPSTRPARQRPPLSLISPSAAQTTRVPLAASTPTTSPSKRNAASRLQTTCPWTSVDIETLLAGSPSPGKENRGLGDGKEVAEGMMDLLSSPERKMSVQEWILCNARSGEERLRRECERLVGRFEGEGVRALKALEGIVCVGEE